MWENNWEMPDDDDDRDIIKSIKKLEHVMRKDAYSDWGTPGPTKQDLERQITRLKQQLAEAQLGAKTGKQFEFMQRIAIQSMEELERNELSDLVLLNNTELSKWWRKYKKDQQAEQARLQKIADKKLKEQQDAILKAEVLARLSTEEKRVLGIK